MGRPTKLDQETHSKIVAAIRAGNYIETAAAYAGIQKSTLYSWLRRGERERQRVAKNPKCRIKKAEEPFVAFSNAVEKALAEAEIRDVSIIGKAAEEYWQAAAWRLERKFPDRWGRKKIDVDMKQEVRGQVEVTNDLARQIIQDEEATDLAHELLGRISQGQPGGDGSPCE